MRLGIGSYAFAWNIGVPGYPQPAQTLDALALVERAAALGVHLVQICDNLLLHTTPPSELDRLQQQADGLGVRVTVGTRGIDRETLRPYLCLATRFHSPILRVVVDTATSEPSPEQIVEAARDLVPDLRAADVCLAIENHDRFSARELAEIVSQIDSEHVGICLDTVNSFGALEGPEHVVSTLAPWVVDLHIKDFSVFRAAHKMGFVIEGRPAGQGDLDVPWLLGVLRDHGRDADAILELWPPPEADPEQTARKEDAWVRESIVYLRTLIAE